MKSILVVKDSTAVMELDRFKSILNSCMGGH